MTTLPRNSFQIGDVVWVKTDQRGPRVQGEVETVTFTSPPQYHVRTKTGLIEYTTEVTQ